MRTFFYCYKRRSWYYIFFIDTHTHYCWIYLFKHHYEFFKIYTVFCALIKTQYFHVIKCFRYDLSEEYTSNKFCKLFSLGGTIHQTLCIETPEQNGVAKKNIGTFLKLLVLLFASVLGVFWGEVILTPLGLINIILFFYISGFSQFKKLYSYALDYSFFRVFGWTFFVFCPHVEHNKLSSQSAICVFLNYDKDF